MRIEEALTRDPISFELRKTLFRYLRFADGAGCVADLLFRAARAHAGTSGTPCVPYYLLQQRVGVPESGFHRLHHTFATEYLRVGGELVRLSHVLGHSQITTTMR